jgi:hypothetical protein
MFCFPRKPTMSEHTPTPWKVTADERGSIVRADTTESQPIASMWHNGDDPAANAALIVKAVNNHDALVAALENICGAAEHCGDGDAPVVVAARKALSAMGAPCK